MVAKYTGRGGNAPTTVSPSAQRTLNEHEQDRISLRSSSQCRYQIIRVVAEEAAMLLVDVVEKDFFQRCRLRVQHRDAGG